MKRPYRAHMVGSLGVSFLGFLVVIGGACAGLASAAADKIPVFVSISPQAYFVERIGGERVAVSVMVGPGQSAETYEPSPHQMARMAGTRLYFRIGMPFEGVWIERIKAANPKIKVVDTWQGMRLRAMAAHHHQEEDADDHGKEETPGDGGGVKDPHIWLSLRLVKIQSRHICDALAAEDPAARDRYEENLRVFLRDLDALDREITETLRPVTNRKFLVFHPAWGYFADDYGLTQVPIEIEGKEPGAKSLAHVVEEAREEGIRVIFVQEQFSRKTAETVAQAIGAKVVQIDPLARDYLENMRRIAATFAEALK